jgi:hypothetical protein
VRATIPGWGVDLNYRTAEPMEDYSPGASGAHWHFPDRQPELWPRERSPEHAMLTPVFGTSCPPRGISGAIRKYAYTLSEGRTSHWMLLVLADRIDVLESRFEAIGEGHPDNPITETGVLAEFKKHGIRSRAGRHRVDVKHQWMDPLIVAAPYLLAGYVAYRAGTALTGALSGRSDDDSSWRTAARRRRAQVAGYDDDEFDDQPVARRYGPAGTGRPGMR